MTRLLIPLGDDEQQQLIVAGSYVIFLFMYLSPLFLVVCSTVTNALVHWSPRSFLSLNRIDCSAVFVRAAGKPVRGERAHSLYWISIPDLMPNYFIALFAGTSDILIL